MCADILIAAGLGTGLSLPGGLCSGGATCCHAGLGLSPPALGIHWGFAELPEINAGTA